MNISIEKLGLKGILILDVHPRSGSDLYQNTDPDPTQRRSGTLKGQLNSIPGFLGGLAVPARVNVVVVEVDSVI